MRSMTEGLLHGKGTTPQAAIAASSPCTGEPIVPLFFFPCFDLTDVQNHAAEGDERVREQVGVPGKVERDPREEPERGGQHDRAQPAEKDALLGAHPLAGRSSVTVKELRAYPLVAEGNVFARDVLPHIGALPPVRYAQNSDISALAMVESGFGVSIFPAMTLRHYAFDVVQIPLTPAVYRTVGIAAKPSALLSPVTRCFLKFVTENA